MPLPDGVRGLLLDVEGTTTPLSFVEEVLYPYARERLEAFVARADADPEVAAAVRRLRAEHEAEREAVAAGLPDFGDGAPYTRYLMDGDRKSTGLKELQGLIWRQGYRDGSLEGEVFSDVPAAFAAWRRDGLELRIFSSGSVLAQKLLFGHTRFGDLTGDLGGFHDTTTGPKKEPASYGRIAAAMGLSPEGLLFLSDSVDELDAAQRASLATGLLQRPGNPPVRSDRHARYRSFAELH